MNPKFALLLPLAILLLHACDQARPVKKHAATPALEKVVLAIKVTPEEIKSNFCLERTGSVSGIQKLLAKSENELWFLNRSGFMQSGLCWWYSRFLRAATYLAVFDPSLPRPSEDEAKKIIDHIRKRDEVVVVPGFSSLIEFSSFYEKEILSKLTIWMRSDAILKVAWVSGLTGTSRVSSEELEQKMNDLYERVKHGEVVYQKLQMPGLAAHAWLVIGMNPTSEGFELRVLDSSMTGIQTYTYTKGMRSFDYNDAYMHTNFVPYTEQENEEVKLKEVLMRACNK